MLKGILVMSCIPPCVQLFMGLALCIADKLLGRNGQQIGMLMYPDDLCFFFFFFFFLRLGLGQRRVVVIIGRWLLPSLVDTGDICCHYWQHILVYHFDLLRKLKSNTHQFLQYFSNSESREIGLKLLQITRYFVLYRSDTRAIFIVIP